MQYFRNAQLVRLRSLDHKYLMADFGDEVALEDEDSVAARSNALEYNKILAATRRIALEYEVLAAARSDALEYEVLAAASSDALYEFLAAARSDALEYEFLAAARSNARTDAQAHIKDFLDAEARHGFSSEYMWWVELVRHSDSVIRLKSCVGTYLAASDQLSPLGMTGCTVLLSRAPLDSSLELEPVMEGTRVKLRTHYGTFLRANGGHPHRRDSVTHDLPHGTTILWDVEVLERKEEGSASNIDDKASEAVSATKRHHETGAGSSGTKSPPGDSGLIREDDRVRYRRHFFNLKKLLLDKDVLVRGGSGTTALVREVCADVQEHFGTIAWISIPRRKESDLISEEIFVQLIFERVAFPTNFDSNLRMFSDHEFSLQPKARCLIVVDNLDDPRTRAKFEQILHIVETCRVIFIARPEMGSSDSQINQYGREFESYELVDPFYVPREYHLKDFLKKRFPAPQKGVGQLIVKKCERLPTAIVFVLRNQKELSLYTSSKIIKNEWEARIPSVNLCDDLDVFQKLLKTLHEGLHEDEDHELDHIQQVMQILRDDRQHCFWYLGIFPENSLINCKRVSRLWAAEGILIDLGKAESFFDLLLRRKCIHPVEKRSDGELSTFRVDKLVLDIIVCLFDLRDLVTITSQGNTNWPERVRYLSVQDTIRASNEDKPLPSSIFVLDVSSNEDKTTTSEDSPLGTSETSLFPFDLKHYKVLDLESAPFQIVEDALNALFKLTDPTLRYLSLSNTSIKVIPSSIKKLTHLEFLVLKQSLVTKLPPEVGILTRIRHILIYHREKDPLVESYNLIGFKASCRFKGLCRLEKLCFVEADKRTLKDLGNLTKLRRLGIAKLRATHGKLLCSSLEKLKELKSLNVHASDEDEIIDLHYLSLPPKNLKRLYLHGRLEKLPDWISSLDYLTKIILRWSHQEEDLLKILGKLPNLLELELHEAYDGEQLDFKGQQFLKLKILLLDELEGLRSMSLEEGTMPSLENLTISRCQRLEKIPSGIKNIYSIQKLTFLDMSHEFCKMVQADLEDDHRQNFKPKPKVYFTQWTAGLHDHKKQMIKLLLKDKSRRRDVLVRGGSGMRALVRKVCEDVHTREHFDTIAWITVPQKHDSELISEEILLQVLFENTAFPDDFDTDRGEVKFFTNSSEYNTSELNMGITVPQKHDSELIREEILLQLPFKNAPFPDDFDVDHREVKYFTNSSEFNKARCLIVVDNLVDPRTQKTFEEVLRLVQTYKVIFMARREMGQWDSLINKYGRRYETYELKDLSVEEPWAHFRLKKSPEGDFRSALKEVCQLVVRKFESLSGAIVLHLRDRKERNGEWAPMILPLDSLPSFNLIQSVLEILSNDDHPLCLLYLSIFPKNSEISCKRISRLWAAEGFLPNQGEAERFISDLLVRKCIRPVEERSDGELSTFQVDDLVREIIVSFSDHLDLSRITSEGSTNYPERARYLSVQGGTVKDLNGEKFSQLRSLFMFNVSSNKDKTTMSKASTSKTSENQLFPFNVKGLQVLDLTGAPPQIAPDSPPQIAPNALFESTCLRYLRLRDNSIEVIPDSIERLEHLEFLDLKQSLVTELPKKAENLIRIRHILIYHHEKDPMMESYNLIGFQASCSVGGFEYLEKLCFVEADKKILEDLSRLTKLMRLGITKLREEHGESLRSCLEKLERLESLNLHALDEDEMIDLHHLSSPPVSLKRLYLHVRLNKLPNWISSLRHLTKIVLRWSHLKAASQKEEESDLEAATQQEEDLLATLGKLPKLVELELRRAYNGRQLEFKDGQFPKLKILLLDELGRLRSMSLAEGTMPCLEDLTISRCPWLERIPTGIEHIPTLQALEFFDMSHEFYEMIPDDYRNSNANRKVHLTRWRPGQWKTIPLVGIDEREEGFAGDTE